MSYEGTDAGKEGSEALEASILRIEKELESAQQLKREMSVAIIEKTEQIRELESRVSVVVKGVKGLIQQIGALIKAGDFKSLGQNYADLYCATGEACYVTAALTYLFQPLQEGNRTAIGILEGLGFCDSAIRAMKESREVSFCTGRTSYKVQKGGLTINIVDMDKSKDAPDAPIIPSGEALTNSKNNQTLVADKKILEALEGGVGLVEREIESLRTQLQALKPRKIPSAKTCVSFSGTGGDGSFCWLPSPDVKEDEQGGDYDPGSGWD